uniref:NS1 n=1 Tax=Luscinia sibilans densovirus TaxID=2794501 RepID=A0A8A4XC73_9VIRU|nr:MAG: NS1 [Luscinia sibilans densovirus]
MDRPARERPAAILQREMHQMRKQGSVRGVSSSNSHPLSDRYPNSEEAISSTPTRRMTLRNRTSQTDRDDVIYLFDLCKKYRATTYSELYNAAKFSELKEIMLGDRAMDKFNRACRLYGKYRYDEEHDDRFNYLIKLPKVENTVFDEIMEANSIDPYKFVDDVKKWLGCKHMKRNTFILLGESNTGKTLFVSLLEEALMSKRVNCMDMSSDFMFGNLINCNLIVMEEPFFAPVQLEDFKSLAGGKKLSVNSKYMEPQKLCRTPIILSCNFSTLCRGHAPSVSENAVKNRSYIYRFDKLYEPKFTVGIEHLSYFLNKYGNKS